MLKGFLHGMFVFHQFLFIKKQTYPVSILGCAIAMFTHFFQRSRNFFYRPMCDIPTLKLNDVHLLFEEKRLPSLKSDKSLFTQLSFFQNCIHVHCCQLKPTYTSLYKYDRLNWIFQTTFLHYRFAEKKVTTRNNQNFMDEKLWYDVHLN